MFLSFCERLCDAGVDIGVDEGHRHAIAVWRGARRRRGQQSDQSNAPVKYIPTLTKGREEKRRADASSRGEGGRWKWLSGDTHLHTEEGGWGGAQ